MRQQMYRISDRIVRSGVAFATFTLIVLPVILAACGKGSGGSGY